MRLAVISDIHGNLAALVSVLEDIKRRQVDATYCLGDIIGYGPDPRACAELAKNCEVNLLGNHEEAVLFGALGFNPKAKVAIDWTRDQLSAADQPPEENSALWNFIGGLSRQHQEGAFLFVHGSPRVPAREYIFKQDYRDRKKMDEIFASPPGVDWQVCFAGHTHHPGVFAQNDPHEFYYPSDIDGVYRWADAKHRVLVNVGSVGQPRDGDWRASYAVVDDESIHFYRCDYDVESTIRRFKEFPDLPDYLAKRLEEGK